MQMHYKTEGLNRLKNLWVCPCQQNKGSTKYLDNNQKMKRHNVEINDKLFKHKAQNKKDVETAWQRTFGSMHAKSNSGS